MGYLSLYNLIIEIQPAPEFVNVQVANERVSLFREYIAISLLMGMTLFIPQSEMFFN